MIDYKTEILAEWYTDSFYEEMYYLWCKYHLECELFDRAMGIGERPNDSCQLRLTNNNALRVKNKIFPGFIPQLWNKDMYESFQKAKYNTTKLSIEQLEEYIKDYERRNP